LPRPSSARRRHRAGSLLEFGARPSAQDFSPEASWGLLRPPPARHTESWARPTAAPPAHPVSLAPRRPTAAQLSASGAPLIALPSTALVFMARTVPAIPAAAVTFRLESGGLAVQTTVSSASRSLLLAQELPAT